MDLFESPGFLVNRLAHVMANELERRFKVHGITPSQWSILAVLWQREGIPQVELQQRLRLEGATVTGILQRMEKAGLIQRQVDKADKRAMLVYLTEQGKSLEEILIPEAKAVNELALKDFTEDERLFLVRLLTRALHNMNF
ncbi:MarR family transcriptional regulator [Aneurinibacillus sp. Ricciae_BoGa-3]|uniref:MarR family winged helix-turn-helix transcriptional regulator n=1 Tax=Aneurinibacillus sp. Ricciae_BoGa-3 TaxID=3022697 RepID=UPI002341DBCF|nr:MarR family transcriptional regulator [Aneurinibacillus sp. Ricciae_BoGa-3]WCK55658.1 MarR family transcriptional regulator [Aneurinibacillus sp. Ricciae_BoGa-3]